MSNIYHIDPEAYERHSLEELERAATDEALQEIWQIAVSQAKTNKPIHMEAGMDFCPHCGKELELDQDWKAQDREME
jgi:NADH pyrophosphatase NudC (nudix superfamily)